MKSINEKYNDKISNEKADLNKLVNKEASVVYSSPEGKALRESSDTLQNSLFLFKWSREFFGDWCNWIKNLLTSVKYKIRTYNDINEIYTQIKNLKDQNKIKKLSDGWKRIQNLLEIDISCSSVKQALEFLNSLDNSTRAWLVQIQPH